MTTRVDDALVALRRIQRKTEISAKELARTAGLNASQLLVMQFLKDRGEASAGDVAAALHLKHATLTSLADRLVERGYLGRRRCSEDRRRVWLSLLKPGDLALAAAPDLLQQRFAARFNGLEPWRQSMLIAALEQTAALLDADELDAAPVLDVGDLTAQPD